MYFIMRLTNTLRVIAAVSVLGLMALARPAMAGALEQLHAFATQTQSAKGEFTQKIESLSSKRAAQPSQGTFLFSRPGKFRWVYVKPYEQTIVADGEKLTIFDKDLNQATIRKLDDALGASPAAILFGSNDLDKRFELKDTGTRDGISWLEATPKTRDTAFERISIGFRNGELAAMELHDSFGQTTWLSFANVQRNPAITAESFRFVPPQGADVIQN